MFKRVKNPNSFTSSGGNTDHDGRLQKNHRRWLSGGGVGGGGRRGGFAGGGAASGAAAVVGNWRSIDRIRILVAVDDGGCFESLLSCSALVFGSRWLLSNGFDDRKCGTSQFFGRAFLGMYWVGVLDHPLTRCFSSFASCGDCDEGTFSSLFRSSCSLAISTRVKLSSWSLYDDGGSAAQRGATITATAGCYSFAFVFGEFIFRTSLFQHCDNADNSLRFCVFWSRAPSSFLRWWLCDCCLIGLDVRRQKNIFVRASLSKINKRRAVKKI